MSPLMTSILGKVRRIVPPMLDKFHKGADYQLPGASHRANMHTKVNWDGLPSSGEARTTLALRTFQPWRAPDSAATW